MSKKRKKKKQITKAVFIAEVLILLILVTGIFAFAKIRESLEKFKDTDAAKADNAAESVSVNPGVLEDETLSGFYNIALIGIDARDDDMDYANSDAMMIVSIQNETQSVRLVSIYRDTYLNCGEVSGYNKANDAYNRGSAAGFLSMINRNFDLAVTDYAVVDFEAVAELVDVLGGIEVTLTADEVVHMNNYCIETAAVTNRSYKRITPETAGTYTLNGVQAVAYTRIRNTAGLDFKRTARQRLVLEKVIEKAKKMGISSYPAIAEKVFPYIKTNLSKADIIQLGSGIFNYKLEKSGGFPFVLTMDDVGRLDVVIPVTLYENVKELHAFLYDTEDYTPSETVKAYSDQIAQNTGYGENAVKKAESLSKELNPDIGSEADGK